jgi:flagellar biosynthesis protein FlhG
VDVRPFFVADVAVELAKKGKKVCVLDADSERPNVAFLLGGSASKPPQNPSWGDPVSEGPLGITLIPLEREVGRLTQLTADEQASLKGRIAEVEMGSHFILVNVSPTHPLKRTILTSVREIVVLCSPQRHEMIEAYATIKLILKINPTASLGLVVCGVDTEDQSYEVFQKIHRVTLKYLGHTFPLLGHVGNGNATAGFAHKEKKPLLHYQTAREVNGFHHIARVIAEAPRGRRLARESSPGPLARIFGMEQDAEPSAQLITWEG